MPGATDSIFSKIIAGAIPCARVFESEQVFAFLDIQPLAPGHTLVVPKRQVETLDQLTAEEASAVGVAVMRVAAAVQRATGCTGYNVLQNNGAVAGQVVPHVHFHIIPRSENDGLGFRWNARSANSSELAAMAARICQSLAAPG